MLAIQTQWQCSKADTSHLHEQALFSKGPPVCITDLRPSFLSIFLIVWKVTFSYKSLLSWGAVLVIIEATF